MTGLYPEIEPYEHGMLDVGDCNSVYWESCSNPRVVLHGGPASSGYTQLYYWRPTYCRANRAPEP
jgi:proline iminopeptidase